MKKLFLFVCAGMFSVANYAQVQVPQPSPAARIEQKVGLTDVEIEYSRPGMRGREIYGNLVPYGKVWRTGANNNTTISFSDAVSIGGKELPAGKYALYTIPGENQWEVIFYKDHSNWGNPAEWQEDKVALKASAQVQELPFDMETFTIMIDELQNDSAVLNIVWANKAVILPFEVPTDQKSMASIEKMMNGPSAGDYFAAATYYHDSKKDLQKAYDWVNKAVEMSDAPAYWVLRKKSLIEADMGKKKDAITTAKKSLEGAKKAGNQDYVKLNEDSLKEWGAM